MTLRHKKELYLKELSIVDRLRKKESMLHDTISNSISNTQKISSTKNTFSLVIEERIDIFLKKAKKKLPLWLKISEKREVLNEIEEEIREHVQEFEESNKRTEENVNQLFSEFEIYISNEKWPWDVETTPKIYISKEVWPWYFKTLKAVFAFFIISAIFGFVLSIIVWINIPLFLRIVFLVLTFTVILITRVFIYLNFKLQIFANVSIGKISLIFLNHENYLNKERGYNFTSSLELINITGLIDESITIDPELGSRGLAILRVEENATFSIDLDLTYLFYTNSYGLFFSGITIVIFIAFAFQIKKKNF